jgi:hypothetical protein
MSIIELETSYNGSIQKVRNRFATISMKPPLYRFEELERTPIEDSDEPNIYGEVVYKKDNVRIRSDGFVMSIWLGAECLSTARVAREV